MVGQMTLGRAMNKAPHLLVDQFGVSRPVPVCGPATIGPVADPVFSRFGTLAAALLMVLAITCPVLAHAGTTEKEDAGVAARFSQSGFAADITRPALTRTVASVNPLRLTAAQITTGTTAALIMPTR